MINLVIRDQKSTPCNERKYYLVVKTSVSGGVEHFVAEFANKSFLALFIMRGREMSLESFLRSKLSITDFTLMLNILSFGFFLLMD